MFFSSKLTDTLQASPYEGVVEAVEQLTAYLEETNPSHEDAYNAILETYALVSSVHSAGLIDVPETIPVLSGNAREDRGVADEYLRNVLHECRSQGALNKIEMLKAHYSAALGASFSYEFSQGDLDAIQVTINELRELVANSTSFELSHKHRLLRRLERLQSELHKRVSDLDRFWGFVGDAGVVAGKFGDDVKPIVDRIQQLVGIVWRTQARAEDLPSDSQPPLLHDSASNAQREAVGD